MQTEILNRKKKLLGRILKRKKIVINKNGGERNVTGKNGAKNNRLKGISPNDSPTTTS
jgi:hypothetical protein